MATTQDVLALGCAALGLKGARMYTNYKTMVETWIDPEERVPEEGVVVAEGQTVIDSEISTVDAERAEVVDLRDQIATSKDVSKGASLAELEDRVQVLEKMVDLMASKLGFE